MDGWMKKAEVTVRTYKISKRVKKRTYDSDVINSIMANQTTSITLAFLNVAEKILVQELYHMVDRKQATSSSMLSGDNYVIASMRMNIGD